MLSVATPIANTPISDPALESYPGADVTHAFTWGNGIESQSTELMPTFRVNGTTEYGLVTERYVLRDPTGVTATDRAGLSVLIGDPDTVQINAKLLYGGFTNNPTRLDGSLGVTGAAGHFKYDAAIAQTGIDGSPSAEDHRISIAGSSLRFGNVRSRFGWASKFSSLYVAAGFSNISDGNHYHFEELGASQDLGLTTPFDIVVAAFVTTSGYRFTNAYPLAGYYSFADQERYALKASVRYPIGRHFDVGATGLAGRSRTQAIGGLTYDSQTYQQFEPSVAYANAGVQVSASGAFAQYLGGLYVRDYVSNAATLNVRLRL